MSCLDLAFLPSRDDSRLTDLDRDLHAWKTEARPSEYHFP